MSVLYSATLYLETVFDEDAEGFLLDKPAEEYLDDLMLGAYTGESTYTDEGIYTGESTYTGEGIYTGESSYTGEVRVHTQVKVHTQHR